VVAKQLATELELPLPEAPWHIHRDRIGKLHLRDVLTHHPKVTAHLGTDRIAELFEPMAYQGISRILINRLLASLDIQ
jgi:hypothetical protein